MSGGYNKLTYQEVKSYIEGIEGKGCKLISKEYINNSEKLIVKCACGDVFNVSYTKFKDRNKRQCNKCSGITNYNFETIKYFIEIESNSGCKIISSEYNGLYKNIDIECSCGIRFKTNFAQFKYNNKRQCNKCGRKIIANKLKLDYNYVKNFIEENIGYKLITKNFHNCNQLLKLKCPKEHFFEITFTAFKRGCRCGICSGHNRDTNQFSDEIENLTNGEYKLLSEYIKAVDKVKIKHFKCGCVFEMTPSAFLNGQRCPQCKGERIRESKAFSYNEVKEYVESFDYHLISDEYLNSTKKLKFQCPDGHIFKMRFSNFKRGIRCPECAKSKGEIRVKEILELNNIKYISQKEFIGLIGLGNGNLSYDFYLPHCNILIEYDGEFHYKPIKRYTDEPIKYAKERFKKQQVHDKLKNEYAKDNNIKLIRIPYWDFDNIEEILMKELNINN